MASHLKTTWHHVRRSPYQTIAAVLLMMVTFVAVSIFTFLILGSSKIINYFESKPQVIAFFRDDAKPEQIAKLQLDLKSSGKIASMKYVSKQDALRIYREQNKNDPLLLDLVTADILPSSLEISTIKIQDLTLVSQALNAAPYVQQVVYQKDVVSTLTAWTNAIREIGIVLIVVLSLISIFIMAAIIGIKISQKKKEIEVMRLLGATKIYISLPFILEGIFYGTIGAFLGWIIASTALLYASPYLASFLRDIPVLPVPVIFFIELLASEILLAIILGIFSSWLAVARYLK